MKIPTNPSLFKKVLALPLILILFTIFFYAIIDYLLPFYLDSFVSSTIIPKIAQEELDHTRNYSNFSKEIYLKYTKRNKYIYSKPMDSPIDTKQN